ncbi:hypothetical protein GGI23_007576, partial [Coemansia sp. RSA 2559]
YKGSECEDMADNSDNDEDDDSSYDGLSDSEPVGDSDEGFDGRCYTPPSSAGDSPQSTAGCSRASSKKSSRSSELSDSSTAADPSPKWWKRHFQTSKHKSNDPHCSGADESSNRLSSDSSRSSSSKSNSSLIPILTKIKRSVSSRSSKKPERAQYVSRVTASATRTSQMARTESAVDPSTIQTPTSDSLYIAKVKTTPSVSHGIPELDGDGISKAQWVLFKCKGMLNLNVVTVPPS